MLSDNELKEMGTNKILGIFGDCDFPHKAGAKTITVRKEVLARTKDLLMSIKPKKVYITPHTGFEEIIIPLLLFLDIPYTIVNPYKGFYDNLKKESKVKLLMALENSRGVITLSNKKAKFKEHLDLVHESENFILDRSQIVLCVFGQKNNHRIESLNERLALKNNVIFFNYGIF